MKKSRNTLYMSVLLIVLCLIMAMFLEESLSEKVTRSITVITALVGAVALFFQFKRDKDINQANFIVEYGKYFHSLSGAEQAAKSLERYRQGEKDAITEKDHEGILNYLVWCEGLSVLVQKGVMDIETVDCLYSYDFFLIVNNNYVQKIELIPDAEYYKGIYALHKIWTDYKKTTHQSILNEEESLDKVKNYKQFAKKGNLYDHKNY